MRMRTHGRHTMVPETSQETSFSARFCYNTFLYLLTDLFINVTFCIGKFSSGGCRKPTKQQTFKLFYNAVFY